MLCVNYYNNGQLVSRRFDFNGIGEAQREAEAYTRAFGHLSCVALVSHYDA